MATPGRTSAWQKVALVAFGLCLALALLEGGLRAAGWLFLRVQEGRNRASLAEGRPYRVLCIGESTTALGGEDAYPHQLERILNEQAGRHLVSVVNRGVPAINTDRILAMIPALLGQYRPDVVVAMMGINDLDVPGGAPAEDGVLRRALSSLRIAKVVRYAGALWDARRREAPAAAMAAQFEDEVRAKEGRLLARIRADTSDERAHAELGTLYLSAGRRALARRFLDRALVLDPQDQAARLALAALYRREGRAEHFVAALQVTAAIDPAHPDAQREVAAAYLRFFESDGFAAATERILVFYRQDDATYRILKEAYLGVAERCTRDGRLEEAEALLRLAHAVPAGGYDDIYFGRRAFLAQMMGDRQGFEQNLERAEELHAVDQHAMTARNYRELARMLHELGIPLVAVQYPLRRTEGLRTMLEGEPGVVLVDNEVTFKEALRRAPYRDYFIDAFAGDFGHFTPRGAGLLAENVAGPVRELLERADARGGGSRSR